MRGGFVASAARGNRNGDKADGTFGEGQIISTNYEGPRSLTKDIASAILVLAERLVVERAECKTHSVMQVMEYGDEESLLATAVYLVGAIAQSIESNLLIREALFDEVSQHRDLDRDVVAIIGDTNASDNFRTMQRNPWMWEAISHMLIHLSHTKPEFHPCGTVLAKTNIKYDVNDHGLDLIAIYENSGLGITAGECKAYLANPARAINDAANKLNEVDANKRDIEIRAAVSQLRSALDSKAQKRLAGAFWKSERCYLPFICCDESESPNWSKTRTVLRRLSLPISHKILYPLSLENARGKFDRICDLMREYVAEEG